MKVFVLLALPLILSASDSLAQPRQPASPQLNSQTIQRTPPDERGTEKMPLTIKVIPNQPSNEQAEKEDREKREKAEIDKKVADETQRTADYTKNLAWVTFFTL